MSSAKKFLSIEAPSALVRGTIALAEEPATGTRRVFVVRTEGGEVTARRAVSCLLAPAIGDEVLVADLAGTAWILAVLERAPGAPNELTVEGDLVVSAPSGRCSFAAQEGIDLVSAKDVKVVAGGVSISASEGNVALDRLTFLTGALRAELEQARVVMDRCDTFVERATSRVARSHRVVTELDQVKAGQIDWRAEKCAQLHAEHLLMTSDDLVKIDGEQIHVG